MYGIEPEFGDMTEQGELRFHARESSVGVKVDKYYTRQIAKWDDLADGTRVKVGTIQSGSALSMVGVPIGGLYFDVGKIKKAMDDHNDHIEVRHLLGIPTLLSNPVVIAEFKGPKGTIKNTVSVFGELYTNSGKPIVVGLVIRRDRAVQNFVTNIRTTGEATLYVIIDQQPVESKK